MKLETLVKDIYETLEAGADVTQIQADAFGSKMSILIKDRLKTRVSGNRLRPSNIGEPCERKLWYKINKPEKAEPLAGPIYLKFLLGDVWEAVLLALSDISGHTVEYQQGQASLHGVSGSLDAIIDGTLVDVKSASPYSFSKFKDGLTADKDAFGYLSQLDFYLEATQGNPLMTNKVSAAFLVGDKVSGHLTLDQHPLLQKDWAKFISERTTMVEIKNPPKQGFSPVPDGKSGNFKLPVNCSYCPFKHLCYPGLRTFLYSNGPRFLTTVVREPDVTEVN